MGSDVRYRSRVEPVVDLFAVPSGISGSTVLRHMVGKAPVEEDVRKRALPIPMSYGGVGFYISDFLSKGPSRDFSRLQEARQRQIARMTPFPRASGLRWRG